MQIIEIFCDHFCILDDEKMFYSEKRYSKSTAFTILLSSAENNPVNIYLFSNQLNKLLDMTCDEPDIDTINEEIIDLLLRIENTKNILETFGILCLN
jgi:hypothetical protein